MINQLFSIAPHLVYSFSNPYYNIHNDDVGNKGNTNEAIHYLPFEDYNILGNVGGANQKSLVISTTGFNTRRISGTLTGEIDENIEFNIIDTNVSSLYTVWQALVNILTTKQIYFNNDYVTIYHAELLGNTQIIQERTSLFYNFLTFRFYARVNQDGLDPILENIYNN